MAQKELGLQPSAPVLSPTSSTASGTSVAQSPVTPLSAVPLGLGISTGNNQVAAASEHGAVAVDSDTIAPKGRGAFSWGQLMWQKWYWGIFFAVAWAVSSRLTGSP